MVPGLPAHVTPSFFSVDSLGVKLWFTIHIFFRTAILRKLFDIRYSCKHCNFSRVCLLVKMASKTLTRSIFRLCHSYPFKILLRYLGFTKTLSSAEVPAGYPHQNKIIEKIESAGDDGKRETAGAPRALFFFIPSLPTTQKPPHNTKRPLRRRESCKDQTVKLTVTGLVSWPNCQKECVEVTVNVNEDNP